ncbi:TRAP transporter large permease [Amphritea japonica]|uniref:TRAP transporter large permease protein n=1 Tax=Amphritea japonica ATCC BAA-1530 TaxID=1278309 RepID=A0A7R6P6M8_9GAMM|nr:TRAP transporter large permease subunit [Amphritea japonica]BBB26949.1 TRAP dicarboxylate transporter DctM subunit [Amphritea japonica ATCC BAA-1530]
MDVLLTMGIMLALIILFLGLGVWVFVGLFLVAITSLTLIADFPLDRVGYIARSVIWRSSSAWELSAIPLFIWMGEIIFRTDISDRLFRGLSPFVQWMPGRLLHTNVLGCTLFAAVSGSTSATTATVGKITTTALAERGYNNALAVGSLAGAGSLGLLIPPSIVMIIYGVLAEVSIAKLFAAGIMPGLLVAFLYSSYIIVRCVINPELAPRSEEKLTLGRLLNGLKDLIPIVTLIFLVLGGIYSGIATPSEAAAVGVAATFVLVICMGSFSWDIVIEAAMGAVKTSCMVCSILISAAFLSTAIGYLHIPVELVKIIESLGLSPYALLGILALFYILLGFFLDGISIIVMSLPITLPLILQAGFDPIWYGVFLVLMVELAQMTPPVGFNLFILQGLTGQSIGRVVKAAFPFFLLMCVAVVIVSFFPQVVLFLPNMM